MADADPRSTLDGSDPLGRMTLKHTVSAITESSPVLITEIPQGGSA